MLKRFLHGPDRAGAGLIALAVSVFMAFSAAGTSFGATNEAVDPGGGTVSLLPSGPVTVTSAPTGSAVTSAIAEIVPTGIATGSLGNSFAYYILTTVNPGDSGVNSIAITAPSGYTGLGVTAVALGGGPLTPSPACPTPAAGEYCASLAGQTLTVTLGSVAGSTTILVSFSANGPSVAGSGDFFSTVDDTSTAAPPQPTTPGNADGNPANGNTVTVSVSDIIGIVSADPVIVPADGVAASVITVVLRTPSGAPLSGKTVTLSSDRGALDAITQPALPTDGTGTTTGAIRSTTVGPARVTATDVTDGIVLSMQPTVLFTQGRVLELDKSTSKSTAVIGDVVTYLVELRNAGTIDALQVRVQDRIPPNFKFLRGSTRLNGAPAPDPAGSGTLTFPIGTVPALVDTNGNGRADRGEQGYVSLSYQLVVGSGAQPREYINTAVATDACDQCFISNSDEAKVTITIDPLFDYGTIIGKVFVDANGDGWQDRGEEGVAGVMVALDDGTYALTDEHGRYHFPAVLSGHRLVKVNLKTLTVGAVATTDEALVVPVTPGLLAKANFGIQYQQDTVTIGAPPRFGLRVVSIGQQQPAEIVGNAETMTILINGRLATFPRSDVRVRSDAVDDVIQLRSDSLEQPVEFMIASTVSEEVTAWELVIRNDRGEVVRTLSGSPPLPESVTWDGMLDSGRAIAGGEIYQYQFFATYADGTISASPRFLVGVNRTSVISLNLTGGAFDPGSNRLGPDAKSMLSEAAEVMRSFPQEKIVIEGHTDNQGPAEDNLELSRQRAEAAVAYLVETEGLERGRFVIKAFGETRPLASNRLPEGRELNRRVEVKGEMIEVDRAKLIDQFRTAATATINGTGLPLDETGRFQTTLPPEADHVELALTNSRGQSLTASLSVPSVEIIEPSGEKLLSYGARSDLYAVGTPEGSGELPVGVALQHTLRGRTQPENTIQLDGVPVPVEADGIFSAPLALKMGRNSFGLVVISPNGTLQVANLFVMVADRDEQQLIVTAEPVPSLTVKLPPAGVPLQSPLLVISGTTDPANTLTANGVPVPVQGDGSFSHTVTLPLGTSTLKLRVTDPAGHGGTIDRDVVVETNRLFLLAFADGVVGSLHGKGNLSGAGMDGRREYYTEGRVALYLKGTISGKYLITAAFDSGKREFNQLFKDLDRIENDRLLTNLDPDKLYPVYGDTSTLVHDTDSQGVFYLAIESEELNVLVGNYPLALSDTELASYRRTLYGGKVSYRSLSRTQYGEPDTTVLLFGAESRQAHTTDELRATGGSLYYLSHRDIIEGSEQVAILVRDRNTGLLLARIPQQQNLDYSIRYDDGRVLFNRPVASTAADAAIINQALLAGNPVFIQVDYEHRVETLEQTASGGRVRQQFGDHVAVGGTYVKDELSGGTYELSGGDVEVRLGKNTRILAEFANSSGKSGDQFVSDDGGLTYVPVPSSGLQEGSAWKAAADVDVGEWFGSPDRFRIGGYAKHLDPGFVSGGTASEQGTDKTGVHLNLRMTDTDKLLARVDREENDIASPSGVARSAQGSLQYTHEGGWWGLTGEYLGRETENAAGETQDRTGLGAMRLRFNLSSTLSLHLDRQETISGAENDLSTLGIDYRVLNALSLQASASQGTLGESVQGGAHFMLNGNHLYVTERYTRDSSGDSTATVVGAESPLGPSSKVYSEYQWERSTAGDRNLSLIGAQRQWDVAEGLSALLTGEFADIESGAGSTSRSTIGAGLSYANMPRLKASTREELRSERGAEDRVQYLTTNLIELRLVPDFTLLGKYRYSRTHNRILDRDEAEFEERSIGLAYRPIATDRFNALTRFTRLTDLRPQVAGGPLTESWTDITSVEWSFDVTRRLEWVEKAALKTRTEESEGNNPATTHSTLIVNRLNMTLWPRIAVGLEYRTLAQREANDKLDGWVTEFIWKAKQNFHLGLGYNFTEFSDNEFSNNDYSTYGWYFRMQAKY